MGKPRRAQEWERAMRAARAGWVTPAQLLEVALGWPDDDDNGDDTGTLVDLLVRRGLLSPEQASLLDGDREAACPRDPDDPDATAALDRHHLPETGPPSTRVATATGHGGEPMDLPPILPAVDRAGRYRRKAIRARGGVGQIWLADDQHLAREVALKELRTDRRWSPQAITRFLREARITGQLDHPGIVPVYDLIEPYDPEQSFYTMRFIRGRTLSRAIKAHHERRGAGAADADDRATLLDAFVVACRTLAYAHSRGVIHRDLKPSNIVLGDFGEVIVLDWGLAKILAEDESVPGLDSDDRPPPVRLSDESGGDLTIAGGVAGTAAYMPPEQAAAGVVGRHSDVYALGSILYEILSGRAPYRGESSREVLAAVQQGPPPRPRELVATVPRALEAICLKAMARDPGGRYASAADLARDVRAWLADTSVSAYPDRWTARAARWARRHRPLVAGMVALGVTTLVALIVSNVMIAAAWRAAADARDQAEGSARMARYAVDKMLVGVGRRDLPQAGGVTAMRRDALLPAVGYFEQLLAERPGDPAVSSRAADCLNVLAQVERLLGHHPEAVRRTDEAVALLEGVVAGWPERWDDTDDLASGLLQAADLRKELGRPAEAVPLQRRALELVHRLRVRFPLEPSFRRTEGYARLQGAAALLETGRLEEAATILGPAAGLLAAGADERPRPPHRLFVPQAHQLEGEVAARRGDGAAAAAALDRAEAEARRRVADEPDDANAGRILARVLHDRAGNAGPQAAADPARVAGLDEAIALVATLCGREPESVLDRRHLGQMLTLRARLRRAGGDLDAARADLDAARAELEWVTGRAEAVPPARVDLAAALVGLAAIERQQGDPARAADLAARAIAELDQARQDAGRDTDDAARLRAEAEALAPPGRPRALN